MDFHVNANPNELRVIKTARTEAAIVEASMQDYTLLVRKIIPSPDIRAKYCVIKYRDTGVVEIVKDFRGLYSNEKYDIIIDWTYYYPYSFPGPIAAYLIPLDINIGEQVFLEDLIEDYVGSSWNQGDRFRLQTATAIWNGTDLEILYNPTIHRRDVIG